jgi:hypothetical protein
MKNPETYAEYLTELKSADVLAKRWNFEPVIPKFVRADEKTDIEAKLKELDKIVLTEQRNMEQDLFDTQTKQDKEEVGLAKSKQVIAGANEKIDILRTEERRKTGTDLKRTQNSIESMRRFIQRQEKRVMISENKISGFRRTLTEIQKNHKTIQNRKKNIQDALKKIKTATPGMDLSRVHSAHQRRHENPPSSAPRRLETPQPTHSARQLRGAARSGPAATSKKVDALQKKKNQSLAKFEQSQNENKAFETIPDSPVKQTTRHAIEGLLEIYLNKQTLDREGYHALIAHIARLQPTLALKGIEARSVELTDTKRRQMNNILDRMKKKITSSQLVDLLRLLDVNTPKTQYLDRIRAEFRQAKSALNNSQYKLDEALSLHKHAEGFHSGKGMVLKLLKPSKPKKARKRRAKKKASNKKPKPEPIGPFRL